MGSACCQLGLSTQYSGGKYLTRLYNMRTRELFTCNFSLHCSVLDQYSLKRTVDILFPNDHSKDGFKAGWQKKNDYLGSPFKESWHTMILPLLNCFTECRVNKIVC